MGASLAGMVWCCVLVLGQGIPPGSGSVEGKVIDADGKPVAQANVYAEPVPTPLRSLLNPVRSDDDGRFRLRELQPGRYTVCAMKEQEGYPRPTIRFSAVGLPSPPVVDVEGGRTTRVEVRVGPPRGRLRIHSREVQTGRPPSGVGLKFILADDPNVWMSTGPGPDGDLQLLVPPVGFRVEASAPGYQPWRSEVLLVPLQTVRELSIGLTPLSRNSAPAPSK
ncbi:MAG: carboxypeptidase-like regulatory domain-containing protein [Bryobacteraceae bacterium]